MKTQNELRDFLRMDFDPALKRTEEELDAEIEIVNLAVEIVIRTQDARTRSLMKAMHYGFNRTARLMDILNWMGVVSYTPKRTVLVKRKAN